jgi:hypothetical protein
VAGEQTSCYPRDYGGQRGREGGEPHSPCSKPGIGGDLGLRGAYPAEDLIGPIGKDPAGFCEPDTTTGPLQ